MPLRIDFGAPFQIIQSGMVGESAPPHTPLYRPYEFRWPSLSNESVPFELDRQAIGELELHLGQDWVDLPGNGDAGNIHETDDSLEYAEFRPVGTYNFTATWETYDARTINGSVINQPGAPDFTKDVTEYHATFTVDDVDAGVYPEGIHEPWGCRLLVAIAISAAADPTFDPNILSSPWAILPGPSRLPLMPGGGEISLDYRLREPVPQIAVPRRVSAQP